MDQPWKRTAQTVISTDRREQCLAEDPVAVPGTEQGRLHEPVLAAIFIPVPSLVDFH